MSITLRWTLLFAVLISLVTGCSGTSWLHDGEYAPSYNNVILGMPVVPADGWNAFNQRATYPENDQNPHGEVVMTIELDSAGAASHIEYLFSTNEQLREAATTAVQATEFLAVTENTNPAGLRFSLGVTYLHDSPHGVAVGFTDMREEVSSLRNNVSKQYLYGYGPNTSEEVVETPAEIIGGLEAVQGLAGLPNLARNAGTQNVQVWVAFTVGVNGRADNIRIVRPAGHSFNEVAVSAVRRSSYQPATRNGVPVPSEMVIPIRWRLL